MDIVQKAQTFLNELRDTTVRATYMAEGVKAFINFLSEEEKRAAEEEKRVAGEESKAVEPAGG